MFFEPIGVDDDDDDQMTKDHCIHFRVSPYVDFEINQAAIVAENFK